MKPPITQIHDDGASFLQDVRKASSRYSSLVAKTAGPKGHNVMLISNGQCHLTKDGISVLRSVVEVDSAAEKTAIAVLRGSSEQTNKAAGDGTTATCVLANEIFQQGYQYLVSGINGNSIRKGINKAADLSVKFVKEHLATPIEGDEDIKRVAKISSNGSDEIADVLSETFRKIGRDGHARVEFSNTTVTSSKVVEGMTFGKGMESPYFATNEHGEAVLDNPVVVIVNKHLSVVGELIKPFEALMKMNRPILLIADGYEQDIINTLVVNKLRGLPVCAISAPGWGEYKTEMLEDIAVVCDAKVVSPVTGVTLQDGITTPGIFGYAKQVIVTSDTTSIISDVDMNPDTNPRLKERLALIQTILDDPKKAEHDKTMAKNRKARLVGGIGIINVGGATESEAHEKKDLVDDAFSSVKSSLEEGVVPGGGITLLCIQDALEKWLADNPDELASDEAIGFGVFVNSLSKPILEILNNAMPGDGTASVSHLSNIIAVNRDAHSKDTELKPWRFGYDGSKEEMGDLVDAGVIDSATAVICTIVNAASAGGSLLTLAGCTYTPRELPDARPQVAM